MSDDEFKKILKGVPGTYDDFVYYLVTYVPDDEGRQMIADFIAKNPDKNSGYVVEFCDDNNLFGEDEDWDEDNNK